MYLYSDERHCLGVNVRASLHLGELRDDRDLGRTAIDISDQVVVGDESAVLANPEERRQQRESKKARRQFQPLGLTVRLTLLLHNSARSSTDMSVFTIPPPPFIRLVYLVACYGYLLCVVVARPLLLVRKLKLPSILPSSLLSCSTAV